MQNKLKPIWSLAALGLFLLIAFATDSLPEESTNETVAIKDCDEKPVVQGKLHIEIESDNPEHYGMIFISQQKVRHDSTCQFDVITNYRHGFNCVQGKYVYEEDNTWTHDNSEDLWRIEVAMRASSFGNIDAFTRQVQVKKYNQSTFYFSFKKLPDL